MAAPGLHLASWALWAIGLVALTVPLRAGQPAMLLADDSAAPRVTVSWPTADGKTVTLEGERRFKSAGDRSRLGRNIECYAALGGTRLDKACGHPDGAVVMVGLYKIDAKRPFFEEMANGGLVRVRMEGIRMNQPAAAQPVTGLVHIRYMLDDLASCGISAEGRNLYITAAEDDPVVAQVGAESVRAGGLDGKPGRGSVKAETKDDGTVTVTFEVPYAMLRHLKDPSKREAPGGFFEPQHFHCEIELLPARAAKPVGKPGEGGEGGEQR